MSFSMKTLNCFHEFKLVTCDTIPGKKKDPSGDHPKSMFEIAEKKLSDFPISAVTRAMGEPGTYYGFAAGACTGFAMKKVAKAAALTFGAVFIGFQLAARSQYVSVNWPKIESDLKKYLPEKPEDESRMVSETVNFLTTNTGIASAVFTAGFLTGIKLG